VSELGEKKDIFKKLFGKAPNTTRAWIGGKHKDGSQAFGFDWVRKNIGFGQMSILVKEDGSVSIDSECMGRDWVMDFLMQLVEEAELDTDEGDSVRGEEKQKKLEAGETIVTSEPGHSMDPIIKHRQKHKLAPTTIDKVKVGDAVFCHVAGRYFTHLVTAKDDERGCQISNNRGWVNGWTKQIFGKVVEVL